MCPCKKGELTAGLIAGRGRLPELLLARWKSQGITPVVIGLEGITDPELLKNHVHLMARVGSVGKIFSFLKAHGVRDLVLLGGMTRPAWLTLRPDLRGFLTACKLLACWTKGDSSLLSALRREIEAAGFHVRGVHEYLPELLAAQGPLTRTVPSEDDRETIRIGIAAAKRHGLADLGQSVVVQQGKVIDTEGVDGTDALIVRAGMKRGLGRGPILVKLCKPQQDRALDMPTIGPQTVKAAVKAGFIGIVVEAGATLVAERDEVIRLCDEAGVFLEGVVAP
jgi:DUF1009 family protein